MLNPELKLLQATLGLQSVVDEELWLETMRITLASIVEEASKKDVIAIADILLASMREAD